jgi:DNA-binding NtrC family response regulator
MSRRRVLVVDDDRLTLKLLDKALGLAGYEVVQAGSGEQALEAARAGLFDGALVDIRMPGMTGLEVLRELKRLDPAVDVIMTTAHPDVDTAVEALREGAYDYIQKPFNLDELRHRVGRMVERRLLRGEVRSLRTRLGEELPTRELVAVSPSMVRVQEMITRVAATDSPVLIEGESGTGKEVVAAAIHRQSPRCRGPFMPVNCGAIPPDLVESEFFGHLRGAFSGATSDTLGLFRAADRGTIMLDEVTELPKPLQAKLLRVLQEKEVRPVGSTKSYAVDVRVIAATNRRIADAVRDGILREDLLYRLDVVRIALPALRERKADLPALVAHCLRQMNERFGREIRAVSPAAMAALEAYDFPGNIRELENILERAYALGATHEITPDDLPALAGLANRAPAAPAVAASAPPGPDGEPQGELPRLAELERELITRALRIHGGDKRRVATALGMSHRTLYRRLREHGIR